MNFYYNDKYIGKLEGGTFSKTVKRKGHLFESRNAYAIDKNVVDVLKAKNTQIIKIKEKDTGDTYTITLNSFISNGIEINFEYGDQIATPLKYWTKHNSQQLPLFNQ